MANNRRGSKRRRKKKEIVEGSQQILYNEASIYKRIYAYCIDLLIFVLPYMLIASTLLRDTLNNVALHSTIIIVGMTLYFLLVSWITRGKTIGQIIFNIKVILKEDLNSDFINDDSYTLPIKNIILHNLGKNLFFIVLDVCVYEFFKKMDSDPAIHRIGQKLAKTSVVIKLNM